MTLTNNLSWKYLSFNIRLSVCACMLSSYRRPPSLISNFYKTVLECIGVCTARLRRVSQSCNNVNFLMTTTYKYQSIDH